MVFVRFEQDVPVFGQIKEILCCEREYFMTLHILTTEIFNSHFHAYEVKKTNTFRLCKFNSLVDHHPLWVYQSFDSINITTCFVPLKYHVLNIDDH